MANRLVLDLQRELDAAAARGELETLDVRMLILDIISLNIFPFIAYPIIEPVLGYAAEGRKQFFAQRRKEHVEVILRRIKKA